MRALLLLLLSATFLATACQPAAAPAPPTTAPTPVPTAAKPAAPTAAPTTTAATAQPAAAPTAPPAPAASLKVSYSNPIATNLPVWMAFEAGIFKQHGLNVELTNIASSTGIPALLSGEIQLAEIGGSETLAAAAEGADLAIIGVAAPVYPFVFMAPSSVTSVEQLKGKKIGVSNVGSSSDIATRVMLRNVGLDPEKDVTIVPVGSLQNRMAALLNGAIDGGVAQPPEQLALQDRGLHVVYDLAAQKLPAATDTSVVTRSWLNQNRDVAQRYTDAFVEAIAKSRQDKATALSVLKKYLNTDDQRALETTYDFFVGQVTPQYPLPRREYFADSVALLSATNEKVKDFDLSKLLDASFVQSAMDRNLGQDARP
jgi:NitT/TauT family transport system substrate-binding protein